jgi:hypothetical protein
MPSMDFDAALAAEEREPVVFTIHGQTFQGVPIDDLPWTAGLRLSAAPDEGAEAEAAIGKWFDAVIIPSDRERFGLVLDQLGSASLKRLMEWLGTVYAGRPTSGEATPQPSSSAAGSPATGRTAKVVRLFSEDEAEAIERAASGG